MQEERRKAIQHVVDLYETKLANPLEVGDKFDVSRLPSAVQSMVKLSVAKTPLFSNIAALSTANYVMSHVMGQCRPRINATVYSSDSLGANVYTTLVSNSGTGKSASAGTLLKACEPGLEIIAQLRELAQIDKLKRQVLRDLLQEDPNALMSDVTPEMYEPLIVPLNRTIVPPSSTRGGLSRLLDKLQREDWANLSIMFDELGLSLKQGNTAQEVIQLLIESFDVGDTLAPEFKTEEVKETPIIGMYSNFLGHTSPKILFGDPRVRELVSMLFHTALARRCFFSMPDELEASENDVIPTSLEEAADIISTRLEAVAQLTIKVGDISKFAIERMTSDQTNKSVRFSEEAEELYLNYFDYCQKKSLLCEDSSITQIELAGRPFKLGKLAAIWELWGGSSVLSKETLESAIYFAEYNSKYLEKFVILTSSKAYRLMGDLFKSGKVIDMPLDTAITNGYVTRVSAINELLESINSYLRVSGVVTYDVAAKLFSYAPFKKVEDTGDYGISYRKVPGVSKDARVGKLNSFDHYKMCTMKHLIQMVSTDTIYNVFKYDTVDDVPMKRSQDSIISSSKLLSIDVDKSYLSIEEMHKFLGEFKHVIATTSDASNKHKYRILLPVNIEIDGTKPELYRCIVRSVSEALTIDFDPTSSNSAQPMFGYLGAEVFTQEEGELYDISTMMSECANDKQEGVKVLAKPTTSAGKKKLVDDIMANANKVFSYVLECPKGTGSLSMARASLHMMDAGFSKVQYEQVIRYLNSCWQNPMGEERIDKIISQFSGKMS